MPHRSRFALGALTAAEIALPPESDCAGPGFLVVPVAARAGADAHQLVTVRATRASCIVAPVDADARPSFDDTHCRGDWRKLNVRDVPEAGIETKLDRHRCRNSSTGGLIGRNGRKLKTLAPLC